MLFRFVGVSQRLGLHDAGSSILVFAIGDARVELHSQVADDRRLELHCVATAEIEPTAKVLECFESLAADRLPMGSLPPDKWAQPLAQVTPEGEIRGPLYSVPMGYMPQTFQGFADDVQRQVRTAANTAVGLLRWRGGELGPVRPFSPGARVSWSLEHGEWREFPGGLSSKPWMDRLLELRPGAEEDLRRLVAGGDSEPFAYELVREAWAMWESSPRSSLLIAITALEVGVKQYVVNRVERAEWFVNNAPSPDVIAVLRDYLPMLGPPPGAPAAAGRFEPLSKDFLELLRKRRDQRNKIAHRPEAHQGATEVATPKRARSAVLAVRQVLLRLDIADGREWASEHLTKHPDETPSLGYRRVG